MVDMASVGGYIRFGMGIILAMEVIRIWFLNRPVSILALWLSLAFLVSSAIYFAKRLF